MPYSGILTPQILLVVLFGLAIGDPLLAQQDWAFPIYPDYTSTVSIGTEYKLQWDSNLKNWFSQYCPPCGDPSNVDLWVQSGHDDDSQYKIASGVDVNNTFSYPWTVNIAAKNATMDSVWVLRFVPFDTVPNNVSGHSISSPLFQVKAPVSLTSTSSTSTPTVTTPTSTSATMFSSPSSSTTSEPPSSGLTTGAQAGIGVGVGIAAILFLMSCYYFYVSRRSRRRHQSWPGPGPDSKQEVPQTQSWAEKAASGKTEPNQYSDLAAPPHNGYSKVHTYSEMSSDVRPSELPGSQHVSELGVDGRT